MEIKSYKKRISFGVAGFIILVISLALSFIWLTNDVPRKKIVSNSYPKVKNIVSQNK